MPLDYPITLESGAYVAKLEMPDSGKDPFVIPGYDLDADLAAEALGLGKTPVLELLEAWQEGLTPFLMDRDRLKTFLGALHSQRGSDTLELSDEKLGDALSHVVGDLFYQDPEEYGYEEWPDFFDVVVNHYPPYKNLKWHRDTIYMLAESAIDNYADFELFALLNDLSGNTSYDLIISRCRCEAESDTSVVCEMDFELKILAFTKEQFTIRGTYAYRDAELTDATFEVIYDRYSGPTVDTVNLLDKLGEETEWEYVMESHCLREAFLEPPPSPDSSGECAIFINDQFYDRFDCDSGSLFEEMSQETIAREGLGEDVMLYMLRDGVDPDDPNFDESDIDNWEEASW